MAQAGFSLHTAPITAVKTTKLRELGVYELPDNGKFVVSTLYADGCSLYSVRSWGSYGTAEYWVDENGRLLNRGLPTRWCVQDLRDTGETAAYPKPIVL
jgi:hypothetical protein